MSTADLNQALTAPGRLCVNPTSLSGSFPYGGTALGETRGIQVRIFGGYFDVEAEEFGGAIVESVWSGENVALGGYLRQFDETAIGKVFPNTAVGTTTKRVGMRHWMDASTPSRPGHLLSSRSCVLLWVPLDVDRVRSVILYRALPAVEAQLTLSKALGAREEIPFVFSGIPDSTMRVYKMDFLREISL